MEKSRMKFTQQKQFELLVEFMQTHPDLAKGLLKSANGKNVATNLWKKLSSQLNAASPPMRDVGGWKKVWADYKVHLKAKMRRNKQSVSGTGGGPSAFVPLTNLEEEVSALLSTEKSMTGTSSTVRFGAKSNSLPVVPRESPVVRRLSPVLRGESQVVRRESPVAQRDSVAESGSEVREHDEQTGSKESEGDELPTCSNNANTPRKKQTLLEYQVENQIEYHKSSKKVLQEINSNLINICNSMKKSNKLQKRRLKLEKEKFLHRQKTDNQKMKLRVRKLELQKDALEIELKTKELISKSKQQIQ